MTGRVRVVKVSDDPKENGKVLREGDIRHTDEQVYYFGIPLTDWFKATSVVISAIIIGTTLWNNMNTRVSMLENAMVSNNKMNTAFVEYVKNADGWNSTVYHTRFVNGAPIDTNYEVRLNGTTQH